MHGAGVDCIDVEAAERLGIQVTNAADANSGSVAEFTLGLILSLAKKLPQSRDAYAKKAGASAHRLLPLIWKERP